MSQGNARATKNYKLRSCRRQLKLTELALIDSFLIFGSLQSKMGHFLLQPSSIEVTKSVSLCVPTETTLYSWLHTNAKTFKLLVNSLAKQVGPKLVIRQQQ